MRRRLVLLLADVGGLRRRGLTLLRGSVARRTGFVFGQLNQALHPLALGRLRVVLQVKAEIPRSAAVFPRQTMTLSNIVKKAR